MKKRFEDWLTRNPLRVYREAHDVTRMELATACGLSIYTLQVMEHGSGPQGPTPDTVAKLAGVIPGFRKAWGEWFDSRPSASRSAG